MTVVCCKRLVLCRLLPSEGVAGATMQLINSFVFSRVYFLPSQIVGLLSSPAKGSGLLRDRFC